jgi:phosphoesterase RecJ-like protein
VDEADLSAVFVEKDDGRVEVGLRARAPFDVAGIALSLGGGGHPAAAGCTIDGPLEAAVKRVVAALKSQMSGFKSQSSEEPI